MGYGSGATRALTTSGRRDQPSPELCVLPTDVRVHYRRPQKDDDGQRAHRVLLGPVRDAGSGAK